MRTAVLGATGRVGSHIADVLRERGHEVARDIGTTSWPRSLRASAI